MQYGDVKLNEDNVFLYIGSNPANDNSTFIDDNSLPTFSKAVNQRDADLVYFWNKVSFIFICNLVFFFDLYCSILQKINKIKNKNTVAYFLRT